MAVPALWRVVAEFVRAARRCRVPSEVSGFNVWRAAGEFVSSTPSGTILSDPCALGGPPLQLIDFTPRSGTLWQEWTQNTG